MSFCYLNNWHLGHLCHLGHLGHDILNLLICQFETTLHASHGMSDHLIVNKCFIRQMSYHLRVVTFPEMMDYVLSFPFNFLTCQLDSANKCLKAFHFGHVNMDLVI